jgi:hypothetical protein
MHGKTALTGVPSWLRHQGFADVTMLMLPSRTASLAACRHPWPRRGGVHNTNTAERLEAAHCFVLVAGRYPSSVQRRVPV